VAAEVEAEHQVQQPLVELVDQVEDHQAILLQGLHLKEMLVVMVMDLQQVMHMVAAGVELVAQVVDRVHPLLLVLLEELELDFHQLSGIQYQHLDQELLLLQVAD
jgi:hypothetical protein